MSAISNDFNNALYKGSLNLLDYEYLHEILETLLTLHDSTHLIVVLLEFFTVIVVQLYRYLAV